MVQDPYYGINFSITKSIIDETYDKNSTNIMYLHFKNRCSSIPSKGDYTRELIYLWCGLCGLQTYRNEKLFQWDWETNLDNWSEDFEIQLNELKTFLRKNLLPLPMDFFPDEPDNTKRKIEMDEEEFNRAFESFAVELPKLEENLKELQKIQPENMAAREQKKNEIQSIELEIEAIRTGNKSIQESPEQRRKRLVNWYQEEKELLGERGAKTRTAKREGISRQTLSDILNKA